MVKDLIILLKRKKNNEVALISKLNMQLFIYLYTYFPILPKKKENISIQV